MRRIQTGQATISRSREVYRFVADRRRTGAQAAEEALRGLQHPVHAAFVFTTSALAYPEFLQGILSVFPEKAAPVLLGCTTPFPVADGVDPDRLIGCITFVAAQHEHMKLRAGHGEGVSRNPREAVRQALKSAEVEDAIQMRRDGFLWVIAPGTPPDAEPSPGLETLNEQVLKLLVEQTWGQVAVFGGACTPDFHRQAPAQYHETEVLRDTLVVAFVETAFAVDSRVAGHFSPAGDAKAVGQLFGGSEIGNRIVLPHGGTTFGISGVTLTTRVTPPPPLAVGDPLYGYRVVRPSTVRGHEGVLTLPREISRYTAWHPVQAEATQMLEDVQRTADGVAQPGTTAAPGLVIAVGDVARAQLTGLRDGRYAAAETATLKQALPNEARLAGFYGEAVFSGARGERDPLYHCALGLAIVGRNLHRGAFLLDKLQRLHSVTHEVQFLTSEEDAGERILQLLAEVGYGGGMISLVVPQNPGQEQRYIQARWARDAEGRAWGKWTRLLDITSRELQGTDILARIINGELESGYFVADSLSHANCDHKAVREANLQGQLIFALDDPAQPNGCFGALQVGLPAGYTPATMERAALAALVGAASRSLAPLRYANLLRVREQQLTGLANSARSARDIQKVLDQIMTTAVTLTHADYGSIRTLDKARERLEFQCFHPVWDPVWTDMRRNKTFPLKGGENQRTATELIQAGRAWRTDGLSHHYERNFFDNVEVELSVPLILPTDDEEKPEVYGVITLNRRNPTPVAGAPPVRPQHFSRQEEYWLTTLARSAAVELARANLQVRYSTLERVSQLFLSPGGPAGGAEGRRQKLHQLARIVNDAVGAQVTSIFLTVPDSPRKLILRATTEGSPLRHEVDAATYLVGDGLTGGVAKLQLPIRLTHLGREEELREDHPAFWNAGVRWQHRHLDHIGTNPEKMCFMAAPIVWEHGTQREMLGVVRCVGREWRGRFSAADQDLLTSIASWLAVNLKHTELREWDRQTWRGFAGRHLAHQLQRPMTSAVHRLEDAINALPQTARFRPGLIDARNELVRLSELVDRLGILAQTSDLRSLKRERLVLQTVLKRLSVSAAKHYEAEFPLLQAPRIETGFPAEDVETPVFRIFLREAALNLLNNALRHTRPGAAVHLSLTVDGISDPLPDGTVVIGSPGVREIGSWGEILREVNPDVPPEQRVAVIGVTDHGPGIPPEHLSRIFRAYVSEHEEESRESKGLGLTIVKATAEAHGGFVAVRSAPGSGATFLLVLPFEEEHGAAGSTH